MKEEEKIEYLLTRCKNVEAVNVFGLNLQMMDLLIEIQQMIMDYNAKIKCLESYPAINTLSKEQYIGYLKRLNECMSSFSVRSSCEYLSTEYHKHIIDYLFPGEKIDSNRDKAEKVRQMMNLLTSDVFSQTDFWSDAIRCAMNALIKCIEQMPKLVEKNWKSQHYELLMDELEKKYVGNLTVTGHKAFEYYKDWKYKGYGDDNEYPNFLCDLLKNLFNTGFIIVNDSHLGSTRERKAEIIYYFADNELTNDLLKKFTMFCHVAEHKNNRFLFRKSKLGKYFFLNRTALDEEDIKQFFIFQQCCQLAYADMDRTNDDVEEQRPNKADSVKNESGNNGETHTADFIPKECRDAVRNVFTDTFSLGGTVLVSCTQIRKAAKLVNLDSPTQLAMLMAVGKELDAVKQGATCPEFLRALIGLGFVNYTDSRSFNNKTSGMTKKMNGHKRNGEKQDSLLVDHHKWKIHDKQIGEKIYNAMKTPEN